MHVCLKFTDDVWIRFEREYMSGVAYETPHKKREEPNIGANIIDDHPGLEPTSKCFLHWILGVPHKVVPIRSRVQIKPESFSGSVLHLQNNLSLRCQELIDQDLPESSRDTSPWDISRVDA